MILNQKSSYLLEIFLRSIGSGKLLRYAASELILQNKFHKLFYQLFDCPKTKFRSLVRERVVDQLQEAMTQLQEAIQESRNIISDLAGNLLIFSQCHKLSLHLLNK